MGNTSSAPKKSKSPKGSPQGSHKLGGGKETQAATGTSQPHQPPLSASSRSSRQPTVDKQFECCVCLDPALPFVSLGPCGHFLCGGCAAQVTSCPQCRGAVVSKLHMPQVTSIIETTMREKNITVPAYAPFTNVTAPPPRPAPQATPTPVAPVPVPAPAHTPTVETPAASSSGATKSQEIVAGVVVLVCAAYVFVQIAPFVWQVVQAIVSRTLSAPYRGFSSIFDGSVVAIGVVGTGVAVVGLLGWLVDKKHPVFAVALGGAVLVRLWELSEG